MGRKSESRTIKSAWIDEGKRIISFTQLPEADNFLAEEPVFWKRIIALMQSGYRVQQRNSQTPF